MASSSSSSAAPRDPRVVAEYKKQLFEKGFLNEHFDELEKLQDDADPRFALTAYRLFFDDSAPKYIDGLEDDLAKDPIDFKNIERKLYKFKGSSAIVGAKKVNEKVKETQARLAEGNLERLMQSVRELRGEIVTLKEKLGPYFDEEF